MAEQTAEPTTEGKRLHEIVLYHIVDRYFEAENIYAIGGVRPNAKHIAHQYGAELQVRWSKFRDHPNSVFFQRDRYGIADNGDCLSAVLIGEDREQLAKARDDIYHSLGVGSFREGSISVGSEKTIFS